MNCRINIKSTTKGPYKTKYRIKVEEYPKGPTLYIPQYRMMFMWFCFDDSDYYVGGKQEFITFDGAKRFLEEKIKESKEDTPKVSYIEL